MSPHLNHGRTRGNIHMSLKSQLQTYQKEIDRALNRFLPKPTEPPKIIHEAMRYSVFAGGKRLRPILTIAGAKLCGGTARMVMPAACAMELIHTYSLIHDDLPAMDDDDLRRGKPTSHKVFGEDMAILAGDALLTQAFSLVHKNSQIKGIKAQSVLKVIERLSQAAGTMGMIGGQVADIKSDKGRWRHWKDLKPEISYFSKPGYLLKFIHHMKTAALVSAGVEVGGILADASPAQLLALKKFGEFLGLAFQVRDDILDLVGDKKKLGKRGSDTRNVKLTYPALYGLKKSKKRAEKFIDLAIKSLSIFGPKATFLKDLAHYVVMREN